MLKDVVAHTAISHESKANLPLMQRHYSAIVTLSLFLADATGVVVAFYVAHRLRRIIPLPEPAQGLNRFADFVPLVALQVVAIVVAFFLGRMYHRKRTRVGSDELNRIFSGVSIGTLIGVAAAAFLFKGLTFDYSRGMIIYAWVLSILAITILRGAQARGQRILQSVGYGRTRVVLVGSGEPVLAVYQRLTQNSRLGYDVVGIVPYRASETGQPAAPVIQDLKVLNGLDDMSRLITSHEVDEVIVAVPEATDEDMLGIIARCDRNSISIKVFPDVFQIMAGQMSISELGGLPLLNVRDVSLRGWKLTLKRAVDIAGSGIGMILLSPFMLLVALLIKLDSRGTVFLVQERMGLDGSRFNVFKFRSMRQDAERNGPGWTTKGDTRVTRIGRLIRRTNIDELPQLINVLLGNMSLVGPRPERPVYVEEFRKLIPRYMERHREKAGLTGWAQVNGLRGDTSIEERTKYDLWYIENWSVWLDIQIILRTIWQTLVRPDENAY